MSMGSRSLPPPTPEEWERWQRIKGAGQDAATGERGHVEIHHLLSPGGLRLGHRYTVGLLPDTHRLVKTREFKAHWPNQILLDRQDNMIGWPLTTIPAKRDRRKPSNTARPSKSFRPATEAQTLGGNATRSQDGTLPQRKRRGSKRGTHCQRPTKVIPRTRLV